MAVLPYQPTYSIQPKYGFRYMTQPPIPNVSGGQPSVPRPGTLGGSKAAPPPVMGAQETPGYLSDPFSDDDFGAVDKRPIARRLGYQAPASNIAGGIGTMLGAMAGVPFVGSMMGSAAGKLDQSGKPAYGTMGTYDSQGNVFADAGRAYDPVTGSAVASYASPSAAYNTITGGYNQLRAAGENPISSALGSYDNSVYNVSRLDRMAGITPAGQAGLSTTYGLMRSNADLAPGETPATIGFADLGLDPNARSYGIAETDLTGEIGTGVGDVFISGGSYNPYVVGADGSLTGASGTLVATTDPVTGETVSLLSPKEGGGYTSAGANEIAATLTPDYYSDDGGDDDYDPGDFDWSGSGSSFGAGRTDDDDWDDNEGGSWQDWSGGNDEPSSSNDPCFLTTAIVDRRGESDDGETLTKLRLFRDTFMGGKESNDLKEYYDIAPLIIKAIPDDHSDWDWIEKQIDLAIVEIDNNQNHNAYNIYKNMVLQLKNNWLGGE